MYQDKAFRGDFCSYANLYYFLLPTFFFYSSWHTPPWNIIPGVSLPWNEIPGVAQLTLPWNEIPGVAQLSLPRNEIPGVTPLT